MIETRELTLEERRRLDDALRRTASPRITDKESLWGTFLALIAGVGAFALLREFVFQNLFPNRPTLGMALSVASGAAITGGSLLLARWQRARLAKVFEPYRADFEEDLREGIVEVHSAADVQSYFDPEQPARRQDLVIRFPERELRVDRYTCEQEGVSSPVSGWCRIAHLPRTRQIVEFTTAATVSSGSGRRV